MIPPPISTTSYLGFGVLLVSDCDIILNFTSNFGKSFKKKNAFYDFNTLFFIEKTDMNYTIYNDGKYQFILFI